LTTNRWRGGIFVCYWSAIRDKVLGECRNGKEAVKAIQTSTDLIFLDIQMPEMDGFNV
jgi:YesN/AraC family two-component response regulator